MEEFVETISNENKKRQLENCMCKSECIENLKTCYYKQAWKNSYYAFYDEKLKKFAI